MQRSGSPGGALAEHSPAVTGVHPGGLPQTWGSCTCLASGGLGAGGHSRGRTAFPAYSDVQAAFLSTQRPSVRPPTLCLHAGPGSREAELTPHPGSPDPDDTCPCFLPPRGPAALGRTKKIKESNKVSLH